jgi:O-methyltransferase
MRKTLSYIYRRSPKIFKRANEFYKGNVFKALKFTIEHFRVRNYTHASITDLLHLQFFLDQLKKEGISGDIVECGSWRGGSSALMWKRANELGMNNDIYIYDSFEGFPEPDDESIDGTKAQGIKVGKYDWIKADLQDVVDVMTKLGLYNQHVHIIKGWFNETTPHSPVKKIAMLHCDGDLYESTKSTLDSFYHKVAKGGYIVSNDYGHVWIGAKKAFDECVATHCPEVKITRIEGGGAYFRKP